MFKRALEGLSKTKESIFGGLKQIFAADGAPTLTKEQIADAVHDTLIKSDVGLKTANQLTEKVKQYLQNSNQDISISSMKLFLKKEMIQILQQRKFDITLRTNHKPIITLIVGVNGSGKTTTTAKLANFYKNQMKMDVVIGAADVTRAAAVSQLVEWAQRVDVPIFFKQPATTTTTTNAKVLADKVVLETIVFAQERMKQMGPNSNSKHLVIIDTAGRLQNNTVQMKELEYIYEAAQKARKQSPDYVLLVIDATTGQSAVEHARYFAQKTRVNGIVVTKLDGTAKGGVLFSIVNDLKIPVAFMGLGEQLDDLKPFDAEQFVDSILAFENEEQFTKEEKLEIKI